MFEDQGLGLDLEGDFRYEEPERARAAGGASDAALFGLTPGQEHDYDAAQGAAPCAESNQGPWGCLSPVL